MARKDLLKGLMDAPAPDASEAAEKPIAPVRQGGSGIGTSMGGAIGAVSQSIASLKARSVIEVDTKMIDAAGLRDRLGEPDEDMAALIRSIKEHGQQVPVMLRPNPNYPERYEVVYGRRRIAALSALGQPVKAMVRGFSTAELIMAQGQENAARRDLSFVEKALFAQAMREAGYKRGVICDALHTDKTVISRLLRVADGIPTDLIEAIGAAHGIGRDRWLALAELNCDNDLIDTAVGETSEARFEAVFKAAQPSTRAKAKAREIPVPEEAPQLLKTRKGGKLGQVVRKGGKTTISLEAEVLNGFDGWLVAALPRLHMEWDKGRND